MGSSSMGTLDSKSNQCDKYKNFLKIDLVINPGSEGAFKKLHSLQCICPYPGQNLSYLLF